MDRTQILEYLKQNISSRRYEHCLTTEKTALFLAEAWNINQKEKISLAALAHDIAKELPVSQKRELVNTDGLGFDQEEESFPDLLHGRAGAVLLKQQFNIRDRDILEAVAFHTRGKKGLSLPAQIVFIADFFEPGRKHSGPRICEKLAEMGLNKALLYTIKEKISALKKAGHIDHHLNDWYNFLLLKESLKYET